MPRITLSSKNQITLPVDIVRILDLKPGDKLVAELIDDHIVLLPQPESWTDYFGGSMRGVYGSTVKEIDKYIAGERASPERWEWRQQFEDLVATDEDVRLLVQEFRAAPHGLRTLDELQNNTTLDLRRVRKALEKLLNHGGVRRSSVTGLGDREKREMYRLVRELADISTTGL